MRVGTPSGLSLAGRAAPDPRGPIRPKTHKLGQRLASFAAARAVAARARVALSLRSVAAARAGVAVASRDDPASELATHQAFGTGPDPAVVPLQNDCAGLDVQ